jgi:hypothetical protein
MRLPRHPSAQAHDFSEHAQAVMHEMNLAPLVVIPAHRHLQHAQPGALREQKQFDVESESIHLSLRNDRAGRRHPESLEPALRVVKRQTGEKTDDAVKNLSALFALPGLAMANQVAIERA